MKFFGTTSFIALVSLAGPSLAFDIGGGFSLEGELEYERLEVESTSLSLGLLDADLVYRHSSGFGAFLGVQSISLSSTSTEAFYGALTYTGDFGTIQIGAPRSALNDYVDAPAIGGVDYLDLQLGMFAGSVLPIVALSENEAPLGLRYDGSFGALDVGISLHRLDDANIYDIAMNYQMGETMLMAGIEHVTSSGLDGTAYFLGAEHDFGQLTAGAIAGKSDLIGGSVNSLQAYATYSPNDRLDLTASVMNLDSAGPNGTLYGLTATYNLNEMVYVEAGYLGSSGAGLTSEDIFGVSLGVTF